MDDNFLRPLTPIKEFEIALSSADLSKEDHELIDYIRYTSIFTQPSLTKDLRRKNKPPILSVICEISRKIGIHMPEHFKNVREWSIKTNKDKVRWDGHLICAEAFNTEREPLSPEFRNSLYEVMVIHKELFTGFD